MVPVIVAVVAIVILPVVMPLVLEAVVIAGLAVTIAGALRTIAVIVSIAALIPAMSRLNILLVLAVLVRRAAGRQDAGQFVVLRQQQARCQHGQSKGGVAIALFVCARRDRRANRTDAQHGGEGDGGDGLCAFHCSSLL